jgi:hypothetical protein
MIRSGVRHGFKAVLVAVLALGAAGPARAQLGCSGSTCTIEITMPVSDVLRLSLSTTGVSLGSPTEADYSNGYRNVPGPAVTAHVMSNRAFQVQVIGGGATFTYAGSCPDPAKPASDLQWSTSRLGRRAATNDMGTAGMLMNGGPSGNAQASLFLRTLWDFTRDVPGDYSLAIRFTLSAP